MRTRTRLVMASALTLVLFSGVSANAAVGTGESEGDQTAALIDAVSPATSAVIPTRSIGDAAEASVAGTDITVPSDPQRPIELSDPTGTAPSLELYLPTEATVSDGAVARDGTVVFAGGGDDADIAVQATEDGSVRIHTVIPSDKSSDTYTYTFGDDIVPVLQEDGGALLVAGDPETVAVVVGEVGAPWAVDAEGSPVETSYSVDGNSLIQTVWPAAEAVYPIVADPSVSVGWGIYVYYSKAEVKTIANAGWMDKVKYVSLMCVAIPNPVAAGGCALYIYDSYDSVSATFKSAAAQNMRVEMRYVGQLLVGWKPVA